MQQADMDCVISMKYEEMVLVTQSEKPKLSIYFRRASPMAAEPVRNVENIESLLTVGQIRVFQKLSKILTQ